MGFDAEAISASEVLRTDGIRLLDWSAVRDLEPGTIPSGRLILMSGTHLKETPYDPCEKLLKPFSEEELAFAVLAAAAEATE